MKRKKSLWPDRLGNEVFIEGTPETRKILKAMIEKAHKAEKNHPGLGRRWNNKTIQRERHQRKVLKRKRHNIGKQCWKSLREDHKWKNQKGTTNNGGRKTRKLNCWPPDSTQGSHPRNNKKKKTAYIIFLDVQKAYDKAWLYTILYTLHKNGIEGKNIRMAKKTELQPNNLTNRICRPDRWNIQRTKRKGTRPENKWKNNYRLTPMDGRCVSDPPWHRNLTNYARCNQPRGAQIPHTVWSSEMQSNTKREGKEKQPEAEWRSTRGSKGFHPARPKELLKKRRE